MGVELGGKPCGCVRLFSGVWAQELALVGVERCDASAVERGKQQMMRAEVVPERFTTSATRNCRTADRAMY
jgi:hypothetical protein